MENPNKQIEIIKEIKRKGNIVTETVKQIETFIGPVTEDSQQKEIECNRCKTTNLKVPLSQLTGKQKYEKVLSVKEYYLSEYSQKKNENAQSLKKNEKIVEKQRQEQEYENKITETLQICYKCRLVDKRIQNKIKQEIVRKPDTQRFKQILDNNNNIIQEIPLETEEKRYIEIHTIDENGNVVQSDKEEYQTPQKVSQFSFRQQEDYCKCCQNCGYKGDKIAYAVHERFEPIKVNKNIHQFPYIQQPNQQFMSLPRQYMSPTRTQYLSPSRQIISMQSQQPPQLYKQSQSLQIPVSPPRQINQQSFQYIPQIVSPQKIVTSQVITQPIINQSLQQPIQTQQHLQNIKPIPQKIIQQLPITPKQPILSNNQHYIYQTFEETDSMYYNDFDQITGKLPIKIATLVICSLLLGLCDEIRAILKNPEKTKYSKELVEEIRAVVTAGDLISDEVVMEILKEKIVSSDRGVLLDGVPRTLRQLELYDKLGFPIDIVLNVDLDREYLIRRLLARRVCKKCGATYNLMSLPPKKPGVCDKDGVELIKRADDQEEVIRNRMQEYAKLTQPLLDVFQSRSLTFDYDAIDGFKTYDKLLKDLKGKLNV